MLPSNPRGLYRKFKSNVFHSVKLVLLLALTGGPIVCVDAEIQPVMSGPIMGSSHGESNYKVLQSITPIEADGCNGGLIVIIGCVVKKLHSRIWKIYMNLVRSS
jgi:hypothetical protein